MLQVLFYFNSTTLLCTQHCKRVPVEYMAEQVSVKPWRSILHLQSMLQGLGDMHTDTVDSIALISVNVPRLNMCEAMLTV